jgi:hypothetical protein
LGLDTPIGIRVMLFSEWSQMRTLRWTLAGVFAVLASCGSGSGSTDSEASPTGTEWPVAPADGEYRLGDTGPGGGIIVWVDEAGFDNSSGDNTSIGAVCLIGTCHYLEMVREDWCDLCDWDYAMGMADHYSPFSTDGWVLPSKDALEILFQSQNWLSSNEIDHGFSTDKYWSSSENVDATSAWIVHMPTGQTYDVSKDRKYGVRVVRAF